MGQSANKLSGVARGGDHEACKRLLAARADPDEATESGSTPLMFAVNAGHLECARQLLAARANANARTPHGETVLHLSVGAGNGAAECVRVLAESGAELSARDAQGRVVLHEAALRDHVSIVHILLDRGAALDDVDSSGMTAEATAGRACRQLLREAKKLTVVLTIHVTLPEEEGRVDVSCTNMGGEELCVVRADVDATIGELRAAIGKELRRTRSTTGPLFFSLAFPGGTHVHAAEDHRRLREVVAVCSSY